MQWVIRRFELTTQHRAEGSACWRQTWMESLQSANKHCRKGALLPRHRCTAIKTLFSDHFIGDAKNGSVRISFYRGGMLQRRNRSIRNLFFFLNMLCSTRGAKTSMCTGASCTFARIFVPIECVHLTHTCTRAKRRLAQMA